MNFTDYQNLASSEKLVLATLDASKRLMGWELHAGSVYKLEGVNFPALMFIEDSGTAYTAVSAVGDVTTSKYYYDRTNQIIYIRTTGSDNPNSRFLVATFRLFFASGPIALPYDLNTGYEVYWEPLISSNSEFGVEIDTINQTSEAIEGSGSLTLINDQDFWPSNFDKLTFENKNVSVYSFHRDLAPTEATLIFKGKVEKRSYKPNSISFQLKDALAELKAPIDIPFIEDLAERHSESLARAYQRSIYGRVFGFRPTNIDEVNDGYPIAGTLAVTYGSSTITGTSSSFLAELSPDDKLVIDGIQYTVATVASDTSATLTENYVGPNASGLTAYLIPDQPKRWMNRVWKVSNHALKEPVTTTLSGSTLVRLYVTSTEGIFAGDKVYVGAPGSGELVTVERVVNDTLLKLSTSLLSAPASGVAVKRPAIQNVRIDDLELRYERDYSVDATNGLLTLEPEAEANASPVRQIATNLTFALGSRSVVGTGLDTIFKPGYMVGMVGEVDFFEVLSVTETELTLRTESTFGGMDLGQYKSLIFNDEPVLTCDVLGRTDDDTTTGNLLRTGPDIVRQLLIDAGLSAYIDDDSFDDASEIAFQDIGLVIPSEYSDTKLPTYREVINDINKSILGSLTQTNAFELSYLVIEPRKDSTRLKLREEDILDFSIDNNAQNMIKTSIVEYCPKEYDYTVKQSSISTEQKTSDTSTYILKTDKTKTFSTKLVEETDARTLANRWAFILENTSGAIKVKTKLQGALIEVGDIVDIEHEKLFVRFGGTQSRRLAIVEKVTKDGKNVTIEAVDLSNAFNRCANITENTAVEYADSTEAEKLVNGYITDTYGMQDNDPDTFGSNLIW
jgi:hypothetical protein